MKRLLDLFLALFLAFIVAASSAPAQEKPLNRGSFRLPYRGCYTLDGRDLETMGGVVPDIKIVNALANTIRVEDPQLDRAVAEALKLIKK